MLIIKRQWYTTTYLALCEETRRTDKRVYLQLVRGDEMALLGNGMNKYAELSDVLTFQGSGALLTEMITARDLHERAIAAAERRILIDRAQFFEALRDLAAPRFMEDGRP